jgi:hypothetical protein
MDDYNSPYINFFRAGDNPSHVSGPFFVLSGALGWPLVGGVRRCGGSPPDTVSEQVLDRQGCLVCLIAGEVQLFAAPTAPNAGTSLLVPVLGAAQQDYSLSTPLALKDDTPREFYRTLPVCAGAIFHVAPPYFSCL